MSNIKGITHVRLFNYAKKRRWRFRVILHVAGNNKQNMSLVKIDCTIIGTELERVPLECQVVIEINVTRAAM